MEYISLSFLGTGNAVPTKKRNHTALLIEYKSESMLIDCGEGAQRQFTYANKSAHKLTKIFITHWHGDHILGLPGLLQTLSMGSYPYTLEIYGPRGTLNWFERIKPFCGSKIINVKVSEIEEGLVTENDEWKVEASRMDHGTPTLAYSFILKEKKRINKKKLKKLKLPNSPLIGKLVSGETITFNGKKISPRGLVYTEPEKKITFILDTRYNENAISLAKGSELLVTESTFMDSESDKAREYMHLTAKQAATIAKKAKAKKLALIHISQRYEHNTSPMLKEAKKVFKNTIIPNDLESLKI